MDTWSGVNLLCDFIEKYEITLKIKVMEFSMSKLRIKLEKESIIIIERWYIKQMVITFN